MTGTSSEGASEIINAIRKMSGEHSEYEIFSDWVKCMALSIANTVQLFHEEVWESREEDYGKRAGVANAHPHRFRRTGATMALKNGMPLIQVSKILGHESIGTTQIYLDVTSEELEQAHRLYVH